MCNIVLVTDLQSGGTSGSNSSNGGGTPSSPVLRIIIDNMFYPRHPGRAAAGRGRHSLDQPLIDSLYWWQIDVRLMLCVLTVFFVMSSPFCW